MNRADKRVTNAVDFEVPETPTEVFEAIEEDSRLAGGEHLPQEGTEGSVGRTMFDTPSSKDGTVTVLLPKHSIDALPSQALVRIESLHDKRTYLAVVTEGPFAEPDGLRADATPLVITTVQGGFMMPKYHGRVQVELLGERLASGTVVPPRRRPKPNSPVFPLDAQETATVLKIDGDFRLGMVEGHDDLPLHISARSKGLFPRHVGVLGTTGGGKSTTVSGLIDKAQAEGMAVVLIDTEGEYTAINEPTEDARMLEALQRNGIGPRGVEQTRILYPVGKETANPSHPNLQVFSLRFSALSPYAVQEILDLSDAQTERFFKAYDVTKLALEKFEIWPRKGNQEDRIRQMELDEMETGYPAMTLNHLHDVVVEMAAQLDKDESEPLLATADFRQEGNRKQLHQLIAQIKPPKDVRSWRALQGKLGRLKRLGIFDSTKARPLNFAEMLQPGRVNIIDLSDTDSPQINNLVIAELLRGVQLQQDENYQRAVKAKANPTPTLVFIEEAHEFLSAQRIKKMEVLFQQVARIARRGRKRWLGMVFITQLPQHLPDEVLGLINNWILHKISDANVIARLKRSIGGIHDSLWGHLPSLAAGQAVVSFTSLARPLQVTIDPTPCKLLMVD